MKSVSTHLKHGSVLYDLLEIIAIWSVHRVFDANFIAGHFHRIIIFPFAERCVIGGYGTVSFNTCLSYISRPIKMPLLLEKAVFTPTNSATSPTMIKFLEGKLDAKELARIELNVGGVGYEVFIPLSSYDQLPLEGENCRILTYHHITDADQKLFGFCTEDEREMFTRLLSISGVGPKIAVGALSGLPVRELKNALINGDIKRISSISGIGKKTAERIVVELRDKFGPGDQLDAFAPADAASGDNRLRDAALALGALGHKPDDATKMIKNVANKLTSKTTVEELIRLALTK